MTQHSKNLPLIFALKKKMNNLANNKKLIVDYMETIWNEMNFAQLKDFIHSDYVDHSLPPNLLPNAEGLKLWIEGTAISFLHKSLIEEHVTDEDKSMIKFRMYLKHIGLWRGIEPSGAEISTVGYRCLKICEGKIIEHWLCWMGTQLRIS